MEQALISRYCGIEDSHCDQEISYQGDGTYFFAYPSGSQDETGDESLLYPGDLL